MKCIPGNVQIRNQVHCEGEDQILPRELPPSPSREGNREEMVRKKSSELIGFLQLFTRFLVTISSSPGPHTNNYPRKI
jgi:hypothetical protein